MIADDLAPLAAPIDGLRQLDGNPRRGDVDAIARSLAAFGQRKPVVANRATGEVIAGNHTLLAARSLSWDEIAVVWVDDDPTTAHAYALADNRTAELGGYDEAALAALIEQVRDADEALLAVTGWTDGDLMELLAKQQPPQDYDALPEPSGDTVAAAGDLWRLGDHRLVCGDARSPAVMATLLGDDEPALMVTDPPYGVELDHRWRDRVFNKRAPGAQPYMSEGHESRTISGDTIADWSPVYELVPSIRVAYVWHAGGHSSEVLAGLERLGFEVPYQIIWDKGMNVIGRGWYFWAHEPCAVARRGKPLSFIGDVGQSTIWRAPSPKQINGPSVEDKWDHPAQKPLAVIEPPILNHLKPGEWVLDPFLGSGTTLIAAQVHGRRCLGVECDPRFVDLIVKRWEGVTGKSAVREPNAVPDELDAAVE